MRVAHVLVDADGIVVGAGGNLGALGLSPHVAGQPVSALAIEHLDPPLPVLLDRAALAGGPVLADLCRPGERGLQPRRLTIMVRVLASDGERIGTSITALDVVSRTAAESGIADRRLHREVRHLQLLAAELWAANGALHAESPGPRPAREQLLATIETLYARAGDLVAGHAAQLDASTARRLHAEAERVGVQVLVELLEHLPVATAIVDRDLRVVAWNRAARETWGPDAEPAAAQPLARLRTGLPAQELLDPVVACVTGASDREERRVTAADREGALVTAGVVCVPLRGADRVVAGAILMIEIG